jgi:prolyl-tRNA synthetase
MKQSQLFTKTRKEAPKDEVSKNAELLVRAGFIHKEMAGVYAYLPLGLRVVEKIKNIVREEMNAVGGQEIIMTALQRKELWEITDRWDDKNVDVWFKSELHAGGEVGFGWSHEEPITEMMKNHINSWRDLPVYVYQFQTKLRNELRAKSGIMRGREFVMKDLYSYDIDEASHTKFYNDVMQAYMRVFERVGVGPDTFVTFASGGAFTQFSHEFQTVVETGEDVIYLNREKNIAINQEVLNDETLQELGVKREELEEVKTAEVGNIFNFGTKKCEQLDLYFTNQEGKKMPVYLGSYGIGITRLMGVLVDKFSDDKGIVWPKSVAPFSVHLVALGDNQAVYDKAEKLYQKLISQNIEVLFDDRSEKGIGEKLADADLIGLPIRLVVSDKNKDQVEFKIRSEKEFELLDEEKAIEKIKQVLKG